MHFVNAKGLLSQQNGINIYRGCTHGCIYCDSRSTCYNMNHSFENIEVKQNAPELLEMALRSKRKKCMIGTGSMCDPYMHCEQQLHLTRKCLEIIDKYGFGAAIQTKSATVLRDLDLLKSINQKSKCVVQMTLTTFDEELCKIIEPHVSTTKERVNALKVLHEHGIPTVVWLCPILPYINDTKENIEGILNYCIEAKVHAILCFGMGVTLREGNREYFFAALDRYFPGLKSVYQKKYGNSYEINSDHHHELMRLCKETCQKHGILFGIDEVFQYLHEFPQQTEQLSLF